MPSCLCGRFSADRLQRIDSPGAGKRWHISATSPAIRFSAASSPACAIASSIHLPICFISGSPIPRDVTAGVPRRNPAGAEGLARIIRNGVVVADDAGVVERLCAPSCRHFFVRQIDEHQMVVGAARDQRESARHQFRRQRLGVAHDRCRVVFERGRRRLLERDADRGGGVVMRPALQARERPPCRSRSACSALHMIMAPRGPRSVLCVVVVTTSAYGSGLGCAPPTTRPAICAISASTARRLLSRSRRTP